MEDGCWGFARGLAESIYTANVCWEMGRSMTCKEEGGDLA